MSEGNSATLDRNAGNSGNDSPTNGKAQTRRRGLIALGVVVVAGVIGWILYWFLDARFYETTDDAYVSGDVVAITSREPATVLAVHADNTQSVQRGQLLVELDPARAKVAMRAAEADLARTIRSVRAQFASVDQYKAQIASARVQLTQAQEDYQRRKASAEGGAVSAEEIRHARDAVTAAQASLRATDSALKQAQAAVEGTTVNDNPDVLAAIAKVRDAAITLSHMRLVAPVAGVVAQRNVQIGQHVAAGHAADGRGAARRVCGSTPISRKASSRMCASASRPTVTADIYGGSVTYHGTVAGPGRGHRQRLRAAAAAERDRATGSRSSSACPCASRSMPANYASIRCASASLSTVDDRHPRHQRTVVSNVSLATDARAEAGDANAQADRVDGAHPVAEQRGCARR